MLELGAVAGVVDIVFAGCVTEAVVCAGDAPASVVAAVCNVHVENEEQGRRVAVEGWKARIGCWDRSCV